MIVYVRPPFGGFCAHCRHMLTIIMLIRPILLPPLLGSQ
jgi:hypothetical protein